MYDRPTTYILLLNLVNKLSYEELLCKYEITFHAQPTINRTDQIFSSHSSQRGYDASTKVSIEGRRMSYYNFCKCRSVILSQTSVTESTGNVISLQPKSKKCHFITSATRPSPLVSSSMQLQFWRQRTETSMTSHFVTQSETSLCDVTFCPPMATLTWCLPALAEWKIATAVKSSLLARRY